MKTTEKIYYLQSKGGYSEALNECIAYFNETVKKEQEHRKDIKKDIETLYDDIKLFKNSKESLLMRKNIVSVLIKMNQFMIDN